MDPAPAGGPTEAFLKEFAPHHDRLFAYLFSLLPHRPDAEDVFQRTSLILWQKFDQWTPGSDFLAWACGLATTLGIGLFLALPQHLRAEVRGVLRGRLVIR